MFDGNASPGPSTQLLDWMFVRMGGGGEPPPPVEPAPQGPAEGQGPPAIRGPADLQAACAWLQRERERLAGYTRDQLARLQDEHEALIKHNYRNEQALILRCQELSRMEEQLASQSREVAAEREAHATEKALFAARVEQLERRVKAAERAEAAACRRAAEFDELESRLIAEIQVQQCERGPRAVEAGS